MATRYVCVHCDERFETPEAEPRCPKCMRRNGLEVLPSAPAKARRPWLLPTAVLVTVAVIAFAYALWARNLPADVAGDVPLRPLAKSELLGHLRVAEAARTELSSMFDASDAVEALGREGARGKSEPLDKARGVVARLRALEGAGHFVVYGGDLPRESRMRTASETARAIGRAGARAPLYPLEVAVLATSALRSQGVDAMVAETWGFAGERRPPDASGRFGYFVVAVYPSEVGRGAPTYLDPAGGRSAPPLRDRVRVLTDVQVMAAAFAIQAITALVQEQSGPLALELAQKAVRLDPRGPGAHSVRGAVLIASGGMDEGVQEVEAAAALRSDALRRTDLGGLLMAQGELERAEREVRAALEEAPDLANAHATLGAILLSRGDREGARRELEAARRPDQPLFMLPVLLAQYHLSVGEPDRAAAMAAESVRARPNDWQTRLTAARIYRAAGKLPEMRVEARAVLAMVPEEQRGPMREQLLAMLGSTALEQEDEPAEAEPSGAAEAGGAPSLRLGEGSRLLGGQGSSSGPRLGGPSLRLDAP